MGDARLLSRSALRQDQILQVHFPDFPEPPAEALKLPGIREWAVQLKLYHERLDQAMHRLVNNLQISTNNNSDVPVP